MPERKKYIASDLDVNFDGTETREKISVHLAFHDKKIAALMAIIDKMHSTVSMSRADGANQRKNAQLRVAAGKVNRAKNDRELDLAIDSSDLI